VRLRALLGDAATFLGWLDGDALATAYANADLFLFASRTDTFGQVLLEAMASGVPVIAVDEGGPRSIIRHGRTGLLRAPDAEDLARAVLTLAADPDRRARLSAAALEYVRHRTWEAALARLASGYRTVIDAQHEVRRAA
jgi:glycosyltransferase involved in cell wall biosynthesis